MTKHHNSKWPQTFPLGSPTWEGRSTVYFPFGNLVFPSSEVPFWRQRDTVVGSTLAAVQMGILQKHIYWVIQLYLPNYSEITSYSKRQAWNGHGPIYSRTKNKDLSLAEPEKWWLFPSFLNKKINNQCQPIHWSCFAVSNSRCFVKHFPFKQNSKENSSKTGSHIITIMMSYPVPCEGQGVSNTGCHVNRNKNPQNI